MATKKKAKNKRKILVWIIRNRKLEQVELKQSKRKGEYDLLIVKDKTKKKKAKKREIEKEERPEKKVSKKRQFGLERLKEKARGKEQRAKVRAAKTTPKKIDEIFEKTISTITIKNFLDIPVNELNLQYKPLLAQALDRKGLGDLVSEDVLNAMIKQENINKIKWRFEIQASVYDLEGKKIMDMTKGSDGDLMSLREAMRKGIWRGASIDYDIDCGNGYKFTMINKGNVDRVEVNIIFRS